MKHKRNRGHGGSARAHDRCPDYAKHSRRRQQHNKTAQLCRQVQRTVSLSLAMECHDEVLQRICVHDVHAASPDASRLLVQVYFPHWHAAVPLHELLERLEQVNAWLRSEVARALVRKRAPELTFQLISTTLADGGDHE